MCSNLDAGLLDIATEAAKTAFTHDDADAAAVEKAKVREMQALNVPVLTCLPHQQGSNKRGRSRRLLAWKKTQACK